jgi:hypothetical protein
VRLSGDECVNGGCGGDGAMNRMCKWLLAGAGIIAFVAISASPSWSEDVQVKYRGPVSLAPFTCEAITRSSFIERVCYDAKNAHMLINLSGTWYHYCEIDQSTVSDFIKAQSMGHFFNASIKGNFDCRTHRIPAY